MQRQCHFVRVHRSTKVPVDKNCCLEYTPALGPILLQTPHICSNTTSRVATYWLSLQVAKKFFAMQAAKCGVQAKYDAESLSCREIISACAVITLRPSNRSMCATYMHTAKIVATLKIFAGPCVTSMPTAMDTCDVLTTRRCQSPRADVNREVAETRPRPSVESLKNTPNAIIPLLGCRVRSVPAAVRQ